MGVITLLVFRKAPAASECTEADFLPGKCDGVCSCVLPAVHVFAPHECGRWHQCSCGARWLDVQQQDEIRRHHALGIAWPAPWLTTRPQLDAA